MDEDVHLDREQESTTETEARNAASEHDSALPEINDIFAIDPEESTTDDSTELIFIIDSNARYIDFRKLWTLKTTEIVRCGNMRDVYNYWSNNNKIYRNLKYVFLSVGCNDLVYKTPHQFFSSMNALVERLQLSFPGIKVILSEVTPRMDKIDERVIEANLLLRQFASGKADLFITKNSNLRNPEFYMADGIHLNHSIIPRFASNIKRALRAAYGITYQKQPENSRRFPDTNYSNNYGNNDGTTQQIQFVTQSG